MIHQKTTDGIAVLRMEHGKANILDAELLQAAAEALDAAEASPARAVVLTGTGSIFSAGVDLFRVLDGGPDYLRIFLPALSRTVERLLTFPLPTVAALNGHAIAGGYVLAATCDRRLMATGKGRVGVPELKVGVPFPAAALEAVRLAVSPEHVEEVVYGGGTFTAEAALERGLVHGLAGPEELMEHALAVARDLASLPPDAFRVTKGQLRRPVVERLQRLSPDIDAEVMRIWCDPAAHQRIRAYLDATLGKKG